MATKTTSKASLPLLPLALTCLALVGFLFTTYWQQQRDYQALQQELNLSRTNTKQQIEQIGSQAAMRHSALLKMCEDVARLRDQVDALQSSLRDQTDDLSRQGQKIHGKMDRIDLETQQQVKALENIKAQLKDRTDAYMNAMINQERELAKLSAEKAIITAAVQSTATNTPAPASTTTASATPAAAPVVTPAPATTPTPAATVPAKPHASSPFQPPAPVSTSTLRNTAFNPPTAPLPPPVPDLRGAGATNAR
ncbi:MAG: hypothetical protein B9S32_16805 [Verrucomicrobia bacterium Tous-C9LFEB]|nr:MAG: hypothetical protein B9S32_16805 [Verrucomicrobia bacterium Tous-C9LFEB]